MPGILSIIFTALIALAAIALASRIGVGRKFILNQAA